MDEPAKLDYFGTLRRLAFGAALGVISALVAGVFAASSLVRERARFDPADWLRLTLQFSALAALGAGAAWDLAYHVKRSLRRWREPRPEVLWDFDVDGPQPNAANAPAAQAQGR
jgi:hypothetical protein